MTTKTALQELDAFSASGTRRASDRNAWDLISRAWMESRPRRDDYYLGPRRVYRMYVPAFTYAGKRMSADFPDTKSLSRKNAELRVKFDELAAQWMRETRFMSSTTEIIAHPAYHEIIQMGMSALPWIIQALRERKGHWYWVIQDITGENPVPVGEVGNHESMTRHWLAWWDARHSYKA